MVKNESFAIGSGVISKGGSSKVSRERDKKNGSHPSVQQPTTKHPTLTILTQKSPNTTRNPAQPLPATLPEPPKQKS